MDNVVKLQIEIEALEELTYKTLWTFENDEPRMKTVVLYSDVVEAINDRKNTIYVSAVIHALIKIFTFY
jgi:hypothetical protein